MHRLDHRERSRASRQTADDASAEAPAARLRILVVDDNIDSAHTMAAYLSVHGHEVQVAHDGLEALALLEAFEPEVGILDLGMPRMDGYALAKHIREHSNHDEPLLIAVTGWGQDSDRRRSKAAGFDHHVVKPADPQHLLKLLATRGSA
jgi:CheY-like chemotaxis protein